MMTIVWSDWILLLVRWLHIVTAIAWIGTSFYFIWLDKSLRQRQGLAPGIIGDSWSVHGGGFYQVQKYAVAPAELPPELHWFKYEAYFTWLAGFALLAIMYYWGAESFLIDPERFAFRPLPAIASSVAFLAGGWLAYDLLCRSPLGRHTVSLATGVFVLIVFSAWALTHLFSDRAAFLHVGAIIATIMSANVFFIIIPNQKKVIAALTAGQQPDAQLSQQAVDAHRLSKNADNGSFLPSPSLALLSWLLQTDDNLDLGGHLVQLRDHNLHDLLRLSQIDENQTDLIAPLLERHQTLGGILRFEHLVFVVLQVLHQVFACNDLVGNDEDRLGNAYQHYLGLKTWKLVNMAPTRKTIPAIHRNFGSSAPLDPPGRMSHAIRHALQGQG